VFLGGVGRVFGTSLEDLGVGFWDSLGYLSVTTMFAKRTLTALLKRRVSYFLVPIPVYVFYTFRPFSAGFRFCFLCNYVLKLCFLLVSGFVSYLLKASFPIVQGVFPICA